MSLAPRPGAFLLLHNPQCSKSRQLLAELERRAVDFDVRRYLDQPLTLRELVDLLRRMGLEPHALLRTKEAEYTAAGLSPRSSKAEILGALVNHPRLLERPILLSTERAAIGRPTEHALELL